MCMIWDSRQTSFHVSDFPVVKEKGFVKSFLKLGEQIVRLTLRNLSNFLGGGGIRSEVLQCGGNMTAPLFIFIYSLSIGFLIFWIGLWLVHILAIIYGWVKLLKIIWIFLQKLSFRCRFEMGRLKRKLQAWSAAVVVGTLHLLVLWPSASMKATSPKFYWKYDWKQ